MCAIFGRPRLQRNPEPPFDMGNSLADFGQSRLHLPDVGANLAVFRHQNRSKSYNENTERDTGGNNGCLYTHFRLLRYAQSSLKHRTCAKYTPVLAS